MTTTATKLTRSHDARPAPGRVFVALTTVIAAVVVGLLSLFASPASASSLSQAGNGVGVIAQPGGQRVGPHEGVLAGQGQTKAPNYDRFVVGSGVSAEEGPTLFRGTSEGYPGSPGTQRVGITPASTDPGVATAFATHAERFGNGVVQIASPADLAGVKTASGYLAYEREVGVELSPAEFASRAGTTISASDARGLMSQLGVDMPGSFASPGDLADYLQNDYLGLSQAKIQQFIAGAGG